MIMRRIVSATVLSSVLLLGACQADDKNLEVEETSIIEAGTYEVGTDLPEGEYVVMTERMGHVEIKDNEGIVLEEILTDGGHDIVQLRDGMEFIVNRADIYPIDEAPSLRPEDGLYTNGTYRVGIDIEEGTYEVMNDEPLSGIVVVAEKRPRKEEETLLKREVKEGTPVQVTLKEGEYVTLHGASIQTK